MKNSKYSKAKIKHEYRVASEIEAKLNWLSEGGYNNPGKGDEATRRALGYVYLNNRLAFELVFKLKEAGL